MSEKPTALPPLPAPPASALLSGWLALSHLAAPLGPRLLRKRLAQGKEDPDRWREKLGEATLARPTGPLVWVHAVSVGEGLSILPLLRRLVDGGVRVLVTSTTVTSARLLAERLPRGCLHQFLPIDTAPAVRAFLDHWHPDVAVMVESEFWPRLITETHARGIPLILCNARMSDTSARRWRKVPGPIRAMLGRFSAITAPDTRVADVLAALGADPARIRVTGSLKRGAEKLPVSLAEAARLNDTIGDRPRWLAASTHPGEETVIAEAQQITLGAEPDRLLILAPRHPQRGDEVRALLEGAGLSVAQRSRGEPVLPQVQVYLADTLGEMGMWFDLCPVSFIGGSLVPVGGHNAYEPVAHGSAVLTGPEVGNFATLYERLVTAGGALVVRDAADIAKALTMLGDAETRDRMAEAALVTVQAEADATAETAELILSFAAQAVRSALPPRL